MTVESDVFVEAREIDAELRELRSFVSVETRHAPTVRAVDDLRRRIAKVLGHNDLWCVIHCASGAAHDDCECSCEHISSPGGGAS